MKRIFRLIVLKKSDFQIARTQSLPPSETQLWFFSNSACRPKSRGRRPQQEKQAAPLLLQHLEQAVQWLEQEAGQAAAQHDLTGMLRSRRDIALVLIGFWRGFRGDELSRLRVEHIQAETGSGITFYLPHSKGDRQHLGTTFRTPALRSC
ncbi:hypothetical protein [Pseudomonas sp. H3(2019)]|uniref:hypothetical protein n=1 Tax=Pseudomonas sp. H3(2019) TaxID=2598724 RepID=UPI0011926AFD|nr:hypothetical protein [Pseudomonas sp. H3(2019)]TVT84329.1 hypothetical protein FPT12_09360 [Pseudomonas sp. H3(2019)]